MSANEFPLNKVPNPDDVTPEQLEAVTELMRQTRKLVAPNPLAQAMYPAIPRDKPKPNRDR